MTLLTVLCATQRWHGAVLSVVTVDHGTRPGASADAHFVREEAAARGLPCTVAELGLGAGASEEAMRMARYGVLDELPVERVALAHHADDQAETVLMHAMRGSGLVGLGGMRWRRGRYVRPLLDEPRSALEAWASAHGVRSRHDPSNRSPAFLRNRLRMEVLPLLEDLRPGARRALARTAAHARADDRLLQDLADTAACSPDAWTARWFVGTPAPLVRRALLRRWPALTARALDDILRIAEGGSGRVAMPGGGYVEMTPAGLRGQGDSAGG